MIKQIEIEEKKESKVKLITRVYSNFILKYPIVPLIFTLIISFGSVTLSCFLYGMWPSCNVNYYRWSGDDISDKWDSYLAATKNTYASLQKLFTRSVSIPYQFELTQVGCMFYERRQPINMNNQQKKLNHKKIELNDEENEPKINKNQLKYDKNRLITVKSEFNDEENEPKINKNQLKYDKNRLIAVKSEFNDEENEPKINKNKVYNKNNDDQVFSNDDDDINDEENVLSVESLRAIWEVEDQMHQTDGWADYCYRIPKELLPSFAEPILDNLLSYMKDHLSEVEEGTNCLSFKSIITEFKKYMRTVLNITNPQSSDLTEEIIYDFIHSIDETKNETVENRLRVTYFGTDFKNMKTRRLRTLVMAGLPLKGFNSKYDRFDEQKKILGKWQVEFLKPLYSQIENKSSPIYPCAAFPFEIDYEIFDIVLQHLPYFGGALLFFMIVSSVAFKSVLLGIFGSFGTILSLLLTVAVLNLIFQIHNFDVICGMALFMNCVIGGLVNFYVFQIYKYCNSFLYLVEKTTKTMLCALFFNSFSNLAILYFGSRIGQFFGFYGFILQLMYFILVFTWFLPLLSFYSKIKSHKFETESMYSLNTLLLTSVDENELSLNTNVFTMKKSSSALINNNNKDQILISNSGYTNSKSTPNLNDPEAILDCNSQLINTSSNSSNSNSNANSSSNSNSNTSTNIFSYAETLNDYPHQSLFDFLKYKVTFKINCCNQIPSNLIEKFIGYYWWPFVYFYRAIFIAITLILLSTNIYFLTQIDTKNNFDFLKKDHRIQRSIDISRDSFLNPLNDNAFVYVWGLNPKSHKDYKNWAVVDDYGYHKSFNKDEINFNTITNSKVQNHIMETWNLLQNQTDIIDAYQSQYFGFNPWEIWDMIANTDFGPFDFIFKFLNVTEPPKNVSCITASQYQSYMFVWQLLLSLKTMQENDNYVPGTLFANTIGFSFSDYSLQYIGIKSNMFLPKHYTKKEIKKQYERAKEIEKMIQDNAIKNGIPEFKGWMTSAAWIPLAVEENIVKNIIIIYFISLVVSLVAPTLFISYKMPLIIALGSFGSIAFNLGFLKLSFDWEIGLNEALMVASTNSFIMVFLQVAVFDAFTKNNMKLPKYGKIQVALMNSSFPMLLILLILIVCLLIIIFVPFQLYPPFMIYLFFLSLTGVTWSLIVSPIVLSFVL